MAPPPPPPRTLDVRKYAESRAAELDSLHSIVSNRLNGDFRSRRNKRRRTTGFDTKSRRRCRKRQKSSKSEEERENDPEKKLPRRVRRRIELKKNPETGFSSSGDGTRRLRTHVWHAKRFMMAKLWGFYLPLGLQGRGRGSRALLKWYKQGAVVHDASYYGAVQLEGPEESLLSILSMLLVPSPIEHPEDIFKSILSGDIYGSAMLHHSRKDDSKAICPVTYMWQPFQQQDNGVGIEGKGTDENVNISCAHYRRLWIWMHPSAFGEGFDCLKLYCQKKMDETGIMVDCVSLDGQLARLEVLGLRAFQLLQRILHPFASSLEDSLESNSYSMTEDENGGDIQQKSILEKTELLTSRAAVSLIVVDPRSLSDMRFGSVRESHLAGNNEDPVWNLLMKKEEVLLQPKIESISSLSNCNDLWVASKGVYPPVEENLLCLERHKKSLDFFCMKDKTSGKNMSTEPKFSRLCPIVLLKNTEQAGLLTGWSIILPISWVKAFWIPLVSGGAHAIGLREKHWIACDVGLPYFPSDFPDCDAYSSFMAREAALVPIPSLWSKICFAFDNGTGHVNAVDFSNDMQDHGPDLSREISDATPVNNSGSACEMFVARTSMVLTSFLKGISGERLLLFPKEKGRKYFSHLMKDEAKISQASDAAMSTSHGKRMCYLRVLLHAHKEGFFDEGAVVCAPRFSDLSLWPSRSENNEGGLQVPHASVSSYFKELASGEWEFHLPEDPAAREAYRRPIGFVTTGFVRGSKRPTAVGLCEAKLLASLRHEQWSRMPAKRRRRDIFVLVRNLRSTAYRLAFASIVLEGQEEDVKSL